MYIYTYIQSKCIVTMSRLLFRKGYGFDWRKMRNPNGTAKRAEVLPLRIGGPASAVGRGGPQAFGRLRPSRHRQTLAVPMVIAGRRWWWRRCAALDDASLSTPPLKA